MNAMFKYVCIIMSWTIIFTQLTFSSTLNATVKKKGMCTNLNTSND